MFTDEVARPRRDGLEVTVFGIGGPELVIILVLALLFVGPDRLPQVAKTVGSGLRDLRRAANLAQAELRQTMDELAREVDLEGKHQPPVRPPVPAPAEVARVAPLPGPSAGPAPGPPLEGRTVAVIPRRPPADDAERREPTLADALAAHAPASAVDAPAGPAPDAAPAATATPTPTSGIAGTQARSTAPRRRDLAPTVAPTTANTTPLPPVAEPGPEVAAERADPDGDPDAGARAEA